MGNCITTGFIAGLVVALMVVPACAFGGSMGPARMTLHTEVPFMSQGVIEVPIRVLNTANEPESVMLFTTDDLNNGDIMCVEFTEERVMLKPKEQKVIDVIFKVKKPGTYSGTIVSLFHPTSEQSDSTIGSTVGLRLNSEVSIIAKSSELHIVYIGGVASVAATIIVVGVSLYKRKRRSEKS